LVLVGHSRRLATPLGAGERRLTKVLGALAIAALIGVIVIVVMNHRGLTSRNGCINTTVAGSLGGQLVHACGAQARSLCASERGRGDATAQTILAACREAHVAAPAP
jgi:hypothetical protein